MIEVKEDSGHKVLYVNGVWTMSDNDHDVSQMRSFSENAQGNVLLTGLGLGVLARMLEGCDVTIVENNPEIIRKCGKNLKVIEGDANDVEFLKTLGEYDCCYVDHWVTLKEYDANYMAKLREFISYVEGRMEWLLSH